MGDITICELQNWKECGYENPVIISQSSITMLYICEGADSYSTSHKSLRAAKNHLRWWNNRSPRFKWISL